MRSTAALAVLFSFLTVDAVVSGGPPNMTIQKWILISLAAVFWSVPFALAIWNIAQAGDGITALSPIPDTEPRRNFAVVVWVHDGKARAVNAGSRPLILTKPDGTETRLEGQKTSTFDADGFFKVRADDAPL